MTVLLWLLVTAAVANPSTVTVNSIKPTTHGISLTLSYTNRSIYSCL